MKLSDKHIVGIWFYLASIASFIMYIMITSTPGMETSIALAKTIDPTRVVLEAQAAAIYDVREGRFIYEKNAEAQLPLASITKVMTAFAASNASDTDAHIAIPKTALATEGDSGLLAGEEWKLSDLIDFTLITSSNDGAASIAEALGPRNSFTAQMNRLARELGLSQTYFINPTGLDISEKTSGAYSSAKDVALLFSTILAEQPRLLTKTRLYETKITSSSGFVHEATNTNKATETQTGLIASKTGLTDLAGGNLAVAFDVGPDRPMIAVVLGASEVSRFTDIETLIQTTLSFITERSERNESVPTFISERATVI